MKLTRVILLPLFCAVLVAGVLSQNAMVEPPADMQQSAPEGDYSHFRRPVEGGRISSPYGYRVDPVGEERVWHPGVDFAAPKGTPVVAPADGTVQLVSSEYSGDGRYGKVVIIRHDDRIQTFFGHLDESTVEPGQKVKQGEQIGTVGESGRVTGPHLHYEVWMNQNPWYFMMEPD